MHIQAFYNKELDKYTGKTVLQEHHILHRAFKEAVRNNLINKNPFDSDMVDAPQANEYTPQVYNEENFIKLLDEVRDTDDEIPIILAGMLGLRRGEVLGLEWSDINFAECIIEIKHTIVRIKGQLIRKEPKSKKSHRTFKIPSEIIPILKKHQERQFAIKQKYLKEGKKYSDHNLVCCKEDGSPINGATFSTHFAYILEKNNLKHIRFHDLRHFNATMMLKYGVSTKAAADRLGHSSPAITEKIYQHVLTEMDEDAADKLNNIIKIDNKESKKA